MLYSRSVQLSFLAYKIMNIKRELRYQLRFFFFPVQESCVDNERNCMTGTTCENGFCKMNSESSKRIQKREINVTNISYLQLTVPAAEVAPTLQSALLQPRCVTIWETVTLTLNVRFELKPMIGRKPFFTYCLFHSTVTPCQVCMTMADTACVDDQCFGEGDYHECRA